MTKQEKIREGIANTIEKNISFIEGEYSPLAGPITSDTRHLWCKPLHLAGEILSYLHSQGVVIKKEMKLPDEGFYLPGDFRPPNWLTKQELQSIMDCAVEPLI